MKKHLLCLFVAAFVLLVGVTAVLPFKAAKAEGETSPTGESVSVESVADSAVESVPEESTTDAVINDETLQKIIDDALTEQQKQLAAKWSEMLSTKLLISKDTAYLLVGVLILIGSIIIIFVGRAVHFKHVNKITTEKLKAMQGVYQNATKETTDLKAVLNTFESAQIKESVSAALAACLETLKSDLLQNLKIDSDTLSKLLSDTATQNEMIKTVLNVLKQFAINAGIKTAVTELDKAPEAEAYQKMALKVQKLETELGREKVEEIYNGTNK